MIELKEVRFSYNQIQILNNISFSMQAGEIVALIGISGSGKTTLFRLMTGIEKPQGGTIEGACSETISYMQQEDLLLPWRTVINNLLLPYELGQTKRKKEMKERASALLAVVGLEGLEEALPHELSGGMRQRVSLVRALLQDRPILLLDEPFGSLDVIVREDLYSTLRSTGKTILMVTHDFRDALALADRILVLSEGKIGLDLPVKQQSERAITDAIRSCLSASGNSREKGRDLSTRNHLATL